MPIGEDDSNSWSRCDGDGYDAVTLPCIFLASFGAAACVSGCYFHYDAAWRSIADTVLAIKAVLGTIPPVDDIVLASFGIVKMGSSGAIASVLCKCCQLVTILITSIFFFFWVV